MLENRINKRIKELEALPNTRASEDMLLKELKALVKKELTIGLYCEDIILRLRKDSAMVSLDVFYYGDSQCILSISPETGIHRYRTTRFVGLLREMDGKITLQ